MGSAVAARRAGQPPLSKEALRTLKDERLAAMVAGGRDDAFAVLYRRHHQGIYRYCVSLLRHEADARDALQGAMLAALSSLRTRPIDGPFKPWLFRIAHNHAISIIRARGREVPAAAAASAAAVDDVEGRERLRTLVSDLAALPERQRGAIVMRELSGLTYPEIGAALGTSEGGGKQLVYEARTALHDLRAGHEMSCELVRERISADDRRLLRGRKVRAHLRGCWPCRDFEQAIRRRRTALAALAPPLAPLAAAAVLQDVFGSGGTGGAGVGAGTAAAGSGGFSVAGLPAAKIVAAAVLAGAASVGTYAAGDGILSQGTAAAPAAVIDAADSVPPAVTIATRREDARREGTPNGGSGRDVGAAERGAERAGGGSDPSGAGAAQGPPLSSGAMAPASPPSGDGANVEPPPPSQPGSSSSPPQQTPPASPQQPQDPGPQAPPPGGATTLPPGTPHGHGGTPPGQGGIAPGQVPGSVPPGHLGR